MRSWGPGLLGALVLGCASPQSSTVPEPAASAAKPDASAATAVAGEPEPPLFDERFGAPGPGEGVAIKAVVQHRIPAEVQDWRFDPSSEFVATQLGYDCGLWEVDSGLYITRVEAGEASPCSVWAPPLGEPSPRSVDGRFEAAFIKDVGLEVRGPNGKQFEIPCCRWFAWAPAKSELAVTDGEIVEVWDAEQGRRIRTVPIDIIGRLDRLKIVWTDEALAILEILREEVPCDDPEQFGCEEACDIGYYDEEDCEQDATYTEYSLSAFVWPNNDEPWTLDQIEPYDASVYNPKVDPRLRWVAWSETPGIRGGVSSVLYVEGLIGGSSELGWVEYDSYDEEYEYEPGQATSWELANGLVVASPTQPDELAPSPDARWLAQLDAGTVTIRDAASDAVVREFEVDPEASKIAWRQDGAVLWAGVDYPTHAYDPRTGALLGLVEHWTLGGYTEIDPSWRWVRLSDGGVTRLLDFANLEIGRTWARLDSGLFDGERGDLPGRGDYEDHAELRFRVGADQLPCRTVAELDPYLRRPGLVAAFFAGEPLPPPSVPTHAAAELACPPVPRP